MSMPRLVLCELPDPALPRIESFSPFCLKVHRALKLCHLPYGRRFAARPAAFKDYNGAAQVPVLLVDEEPVADSTRIVSRLDAISGNALSCHLDRTKRGEALLWEEMADTVLNGFVVAARWIDDANWPTTKARYFTGMPALVRAFVPDSLRRRVRGALWARDVIRPNLEVCWARFEETLDALDERAPARGYWLGDAPSRADVAIFAQVHSLRTELTPRQAERVAARARLSAWLDRVDDACTSLASAGAEAISRAESDSPDLAPRAAALFG